MKRGFVVAAGGAAILIAGLSGCSSDTKSDEATSAADKPTAEATAKVTSDSGAAAVGSGDTKVTIDGQDQSISGTIVCSDMGGNLNIAIGDAGAGIGAVVSSGDTPTVQSVALGNVNGVSLGYQSGTGQGEATVTKDGKTYKITGTATGVDMANPMQPTTKPFEIEVACP